MLRNHGEWRDCFQIMVTVLKDEQISLLFLLSPLPEEQSNANQVKQEIQDFKSSGKLNSKTPEYENSSDPQRAFKG